MVTEAPRMQPAYIETALNAQIAALQRRNTWLERQVELERARVPQNYVDRKLGGKSLEELAQLTARQQADLFRFVYYCLETASVTEERPLAPSIPVHNLEWNGELPHPIWNEARTGFLHMSTKETRRVNNEAREFGYWRIISAIRPDGSRDHFSVRTIHLPQFRDDISLIFSTPPDEYGIMKKGAQLADTDKVAELFDFARGVRGGLRVVRHNLIFRPVSDD